MCKECAGSQQSVVLFKGDQWKNKRLLKMRPIKTVAFVKGMGQRTRTAMIYQLKMFCQKLKILQKTHKQRKQKSNELMNKQITTVKQDTIATKSTLKEHISFFKALKHYFQQSPRILESCVHTLYRQNLQARFSMLSLKNGGENVQSP